MLKAIVVALVLLVAAGIAIVAVAWWRWNAAIESDIARVLTAGGAAPIIDDAKLASLPDPVRRYLVASGVVGKPIPRTVRLTQRGRIRGAPEDSWMNFEAVEVYSTDPPAFVWKASFPTRNLPIVLGRDTYLDGESSILMKMLSLFPIADEHGDAVREAGLMRYLNEMMWFPAAFLGDNVTWRDIDNRSAEVTLADSGMSVSAILFFDDQDRLVNFRAQRFNTATRTTETWETPIVAWADYGGVTLPSHGSAVWKLAGGDFAYIELDIVSAEYDP